MYAEPVSWISGPNSPEASTRQFFTGTDLGIPIEIAVGVSVNAGNVIEGTYTQPILAFGDTNGPAPGYAKICDNMFGQLFPRDPIGASSVLYPLTNRTLDIAAQSNFTDIRSKLSFDSQPIPRDRGTLAESSCIPTSGMAIERAPLNGLQTIICSYMSIVQFDGAGLWRTNYGGYAFSTNYGISWSKPARARWYNNSKWDDPWQMATIARKNQFDRYLYVLGTPNGRFGGAKISRVEQGRILDISAYPSPYTYWDGASWVADRRKAVDVIPAPVGELSLMWHAASNQWLAGYLNEYKAAIVVRTAPNPWGPWSEENIVATGAQFPQLYGCFFFSRTSFYPSPMFTMSQFGQYNVRLMRLVL